MDGRRTNYIISAVLFFAGTALIFHSQAVIVGAFTGTAPVASVLTILGFCWVAASVALLALQDLGRLTQSAFVDRLIRMAGKPGDSAVILDNSMLSQYERDAQNIFTNLSMRGYRDILVPKSVMKEVPHYMLKKNQALKTTLEMYVRKTDKVDVTDEDRRDAEYFMMCTGKAASYEKTMLPIISDKDKWDKADPDARVAMVYRDREFRRVLENEGVTEEMIREDPDYVLKKIEKAMHHCRMSEADCDVLALALHMAKKGKHAVIAAVDRHFKQAVELIKKYKPGLKIEYAHNM